MTAAFFNFSPQEMMFYLSRRVREVETQEKNIHGLVLNKTRRTFHVTFPISGLNIVKTVALQGAELFPADPASEDERKITELKSRDSIWSEKGRLKFEVEATYFDEAAQEARRKATVFLDWLSYSLKLSLLGFRISGQVIFVPWVRDRSLALLAFGDQAYVKDTSEPKLKACVVDFRTIKITPTAELADSDWEFYGKLRAEIEASGNGHGELPNLLSTIHWLRRSRESIDARDKLADLWIALEFLVASQTPPPICRAEFLKALSEVIKSAGEILQLDNSKQLVDKFRNAVTMPTLRDKFDEYVKRFDVQIEKAEYAAVWDRLRDARNALEHGRGGEIDQSDLEIMEQMITKMVWVAANHSGIAVPS